MKFAAILPALMLMTGTVRAQAPAAKPGSIEGVVTNSVTNEPVKKAVVTLEDTKSHGNNRTATTDAVGHFQFDGVNPGAYSLAADRDGYLGSQSSPLVRSAQVTVADEQHVQDVALKLLPLATLSGHVLDDDGDPIVRADVSVLTYVYNQGPKQLNQAASAQSNDLGEFEALNLPPGRYYIRVMTLLNWNIPPHTRWSHPEEAYPLVFYPNASEAAQATAFDVAPGAHVTNIDFRLRKMPAYHIRGIVSDVTARKLDANDRVMAEISGSNFGAGLSQSSVQADGSFELRGLASGSYVVSHMRFVPGENAFSTHQTVRIADSDVNGVSLVQKPLVNVSGTVTVEGSQPGKLDLQISLSQPNVRGGDHIGADGKFTITDVPPELCHLQVFNVPPGKYVKSIRFGDQEVKNSEIDLSSGASGALNILLGADGGEVDGMVENASGQPAGGVQVTLAPAEEYDGRDDLLKRMSTDAAGNFKIPDVAPGEYKVFAWESDPQDSTQSAEFRKPFESRSVAVTIGPKDKASVQLNVITAEDMEKERSKLP